MNTEINSSNPNFGARIKLRAPNVKQLAQSTIGTAALGAASVSAAELGVSIVALDNGLPEPNFPSAADSITGLGETPKEILKSHQHSLTSAGGRYDAAGYMPGIPAQSTIAPSIPLVSSLYSSKGASNAWKLASGDNMQATALASSNLAMNKNIQKSVAGTGILATAAGSLYSGFADLEKVNATLPAASAMDEDTQSITKSSGLFTVGTPLVVNSSLASGKLSNTESSKFIENTLEGIDNNDKKLPS